MERSRCAFESFHPLVTIVFFAAVIAVTMLFMHPVFLGISFISAMILMIIINGRAALISFVKYILPIVILVTLGNPLFNHRGVTILFYMWDNPITLESIVYGISSSAMIAAVIMWFSCLNSIMKSDKIVYLTGRLIPSLALMISMMLRFVPLFKERIRQIVLAQRGYGRDPESGNMIKRVKCALSVLSAMVSWALEGSIITSDSMRARGFGLKGRTTYAPFRFEKRDAVALAIICMSTALSALIVSVSEVRVSFFPVLYAGGMSGYGFWSCAAFAITAFLPTIIEIYEAIVWRSLKLRI